MLDKSDVERGKKADFIVLAENISKSVLCMILFFIHLFFFPLFLTLMENLPSTFLCLCLHLSPFLPSCQGPE